MKRTQLLVGSVGTEKPPLGWFISARRNVEMCLRDDLMMVGLFTYLVYWGLWIYSWECLASSNKISWDGSMGCSFLYRQKNMQHFSSQFSICLASWLHPWDTNGDAIQTAHWFGRRQDEKGWAAQTVWVGFLRWKPCTAEDQTQCQYVFSLFCWVFNPIYSRGGFMGVSENRIQKAIWCFKVVSNVSNIIFPIKICIFLGNSDQTSQRFRPNFLKSSFIPFRSQRSGWWRTTWRWYRTNQPKCPSTRCWWVQ